MNKFKFFPIFFVFLLVLFLSISCIYAEDNATNVGEVNIGANNVSMHYKNGSGIVMGLTDSNNVPISNESLIININGVNYTRKTNDSGQAFIKINLIPGKYLVNVCFLGNDKYLSSNKIVNVDVLPTIKGNDLVKYYRNATPYQATFLDGTGNPLINKNVTFNINGVFYTRKTNNEGVAKLNINLNSGNYILTAYNPNDGYSFSNNIKVLPTLNGSDLYKVYMDKKQYLASFRDYVGNPLVNKNITFNINGVLYTRMTNGDGVAKLNIRLSPGEYIITSYNSLTSEACSNKVRVYSFSDTKLSSRDYSFKANDNDTIEVKLVDRFNYGVNGEIITLTVNNKVYTETTGDDGVANFHLDLDQGNYTLNFKHEANSKYGESSIKTNLEMYTGPKVSFKGEDDIIISGENYSVILYDENNLVFSNQTVCFDINSNIYSAITDNNGVASIKVNLSAGVYDIAYFFNATDYKFVSGFSKISVLEKGETKFVQLTNFVTEGIEEKLEVSLIADGVVGVSGEKVIIEINGINYTRTTDDSGIAGLTIRLMPGTYNVKYYYEGKGFFKGSVCSSKLTVKERAPARFILLAGDTFHKNAGITYDIQLISTNGLANRDVVVKVGSKSYNLKTDNEGIVSLNINNLNEGSYEITYKFRGDSSYAPCEGASKLTITSQIPYGYSYWVRYNHMYSLNLASLSSQGTKHIFLHSYAFTAYGESSVVSWIKTANSYGIKVHIWMQVFYGGNGWVRPVNDDGSYKYSFMNSKINEAKYYASIKEISGVHFDYLRFGGTAHYYSTSTSAINYFVSQVSTAVKSVNPNCLLSAAVMPEPGMMTYYYGQDIPTISKYLDIIVPMVYKGNYGKNTAWIQSTTKWFVENSNGAQIWTGLQTYRSDDDISLLGYNELFNDAQAALNGGARGITMFRWGLVNHINFNALKMS